MTALPEDMIHLTFEFKDPDEPTFLNSRVLDEDTRGCYTNVSISEKLENNTRLVTFKNESETHEIAVATFLENKPIFFSFSILPDEGGGGPSRETLSSYSSIFPHPELLHLTSNQQELPGQGWGHSIYLELEPKRRNS